MNCLRGRVFLEEIVEILVSVWNILLFNKRVKDYRVSIFRLKLGKWDQN